MKNLKTTEVTLPLGVFSGHNCADGCIYWNPRDKDSKGRQYCSLWRQYVDPKERHGCTDLRGDIWDF